jgi:hypothetical protein
MDIFFLVFCSLLTIPRPGSGDIDRARRTFPDRIGRRDVDEVNLTGLQLSEGPLGGIWGHLSDGPLLVLALRAERGQGQIVS